MPRITKKERNKISLRRNGFQGKVFRGSFPKEALSHALFRGSMTLEAALVLPVFLFAAAAILSLFLMMQVQYTVGNALDCAVAETVLLKETSEKTVENLTKAAFYKELAVQKCPLSRIQLGIAGFSWKGTSVDSAYIDVLVTYRMKFPIRLFGMSAMKASNGCRMHRWTGYQENDEGKQAKQWVFVTPNQSVYHESRDCSHLQLSIQRITTAKLKERFGGYLPCGHCAEGKKPKGVVYVTEEGSCYHVQIDCSGLKRTIYRIPKSQTGGRPPCSRCGKKAG